MKRYDITWLGLNTNRNGPTQSEFWHSAGNEHSVFILRFAMQHCTYITNESTLFLLKECQLNKCSRDNKLSNFPYPFTKKIPNLASN